MNPPKTGMRILNQFTETFSETISKKIKSAAKNRHKCRMNSIKNPRIEKEKHYYNPKFTGFKKLGLIPNYMKEEVLIEMLSLVQRYKKYKTKLIFQELNGQNNRY